MAVSTEYSLEYSFHIPDIRELKPGDIVSSSSKVVSSPAGYPLHFSLHLIFDKALHRIGFAAKGPNKGPVRESRFRIQLRLEQPSDVPFLPPLTIRPIDFNQSVGYKFTLSKLKYHFSDYRYLVGPQQPANWGLSWSEFKSFGPTPDPEMAEDEVCQQVFQRADPTPCSEAGEFRFHLLDEPRHLLAALPPVSNADWSILPKEMISAVLRELPLADRVSARLVCHAWKRILDTDSRAWSNVYHLQSIGKNVFPVNSYGYHDGRLHQVRDQKLYKGLGFLTSRKAPIHTLELKQNPHDLYQGLKHLPSVLWQHGIKLKALLFHATRNWQDEDKDAERALVKLIKSHPSLERLRIESVLIPLPILYQALPRLRILILHMGSFECLRGFQAHPPPWLSDLDGLCLYYNDFCGGVDLMTELKLRKLSRFVERQGSDLRRVKSQEAETPDGYLTPYVWGTEKLSPAAAAFLLTLSLASSYQYYL